MTDSTFPRLYMAFYPRQSSTDNPVKYHTGLIYVPKPPDKGNRKEAVRYHLKIVKKDGNELWEFDAKEVHRKTKTLVSVSCLGVVKVTEAKLREKLQAIPLKQNQSTWRCRHWTWEAIKILNDAGYIETQSLKAEELWNKQVAATDAAAADSKKPFPALDKTGKQMEKSGLEL